MTEHFKLAHALRHFFVQYMLTIALREIGESWSRKTETQLCNVMRSSVSNVDVPGNLMAHASSHRLLCRL